MEKSKLVFQTDSDVVNLAYKEEQHYVIEFANIPEQKKEFCAIYFSSNDIYYPNNEQSFSEQILSKNKFEWYKTRITKAHKHIFLRDIKKQWYLTGINQKIDCIEKLYDFLVEETRNYKIITIGSSAGGFAAVLLGSMLNAELILTFNGQFMLTDRLIDSSEEIDPIIFREKDNSQINKYFSLRQFIRNPDRIYYYYSSNSDWDRSQYNHIADFSFKFIPFNTSHHGIPFLKICLDKIINDPIKTTGRYVGKMNNPIMFSIKIVGLFDTLRYLTIFGTSKYKKVLHLIFKRLKNKTPEAVC